jgi:deoxyribonuclease-4
MKLGIHVSVAGGLEQAPDRAHELGCNTFQIFISNPRGWRPTILSGQTATLFKEKCLEYNIEDPIAHSIYLINLASPKDDFRELSIQSLISNLINADKLGLSGLVTHIGSHQGDGLEKGIERVVGALKQILNDSTCCAQLLLENTAGAGNLVGKNFEEIGEIIRQVDSDRLGICLDTAHAFEYGYKIQTEEGLETLLAEIDSNVGLSKLKAIHLNDSMTEYGSNRDRHEEFGEGHIGKASLTRVINHPKLKRLPFIMETPKLKSGQAGKEFIDEIRNLQK